MGGHDDVAWQLDDVAWQLLDACNGGAQDGCDVRRPGLGAFQEWRAEGVVVAIGLRTEVGRIAASVTATGTTKPPLVIRMERFARQISLAVLAVCGVLGCRMANGSTSLVRPTMGSVR